jgi:hypothetical protein
MRKVLTTILFLSTILLNGAIFWDGSESSDFADVNNWNGQNPPSAISGEALNHDTNGGNAPELSIGDFSIVSYVFGAGSSGVGQSTGLTLSGGSLTTSGDFEVATGRDDHFATVTMTGGLLGIGGNLDAIDNADDGFTESLTINQSGGIIEGANQLRGDVNVNVSGGIFRVGSSTTFGSTTTFAGSGSWFNNDSDFSLSASGVVEFDVFQFNHDQFKLDTLGTGYTTSLDLTGGTVKIVFAEDFTLSVGDSWDFILDGPIDYSTVSSANIDSSLSFDGSQVITWDTTNWEGEGILEIASISPVPEPAAIAILLGFFALLAALIRRRVQP